MKILTLEMIIIIAIAVKMVCGILSLEHKLDKIIELNTPEYINVVPENVIIEKH